MNKDIKTKIYKYDMGEFIANEISNKDSNIKRFAKECDIPYWKFMRQRAYERDMSFREFLVIMNELNLSIDSFVDIILNKPIDSIKKKQLVRDLKEKEVDRILEMIQLSDSQRASCIKLLEAAMELAKQDNLHK